MSIANAKTREWKVDVEYSILYCTGKNKSNQRNACQPAYLNIPTTNNMQGGYEYYQAIQTKKGLLLDYTHFPTFPSIKSTPDYVSLRARNSNAKDSAY
jgi:hypothetical protein